MDAILLITTLFALYGAYLNSVGKWHSFAIWTATNAVFMLNNLSIGQWQQAVLFAVYLIFSFNGLMNAKFKLAKCE
jgi:hypothetical protein